MTPGFHSVNMTLNPCYGGGCRRERILQRCFVGKSLVFQSDPMPRRENKGRPSSAPVRVKTSILVRMTVLEPFDNGNAEESRPQG